MRRRHTPRAALDAIYASPNKGYGGAGQLGVEAVFAQASFGFPLNDAGNGAVALGLNVGSVGSATFVRATTAATRLASGLWNLGVASGTARSYYYPSGAYGGYLSEPAATQLALNPRDMTQAAWIAVTMTTAQTSTGIDGVGNSCTRITAAGANSTILQTVVAAATSRTYSCFVKRITGSGTVLLKQGTATLDITALINTTSFTQVLLNDNELNVAFGIQINTSGDALDVDCNQFEAGAVATTPIPSGGTRNADVLTLTSSGNAIVTAGAIYAETALNTAATTSVGYAFAISDGSANNRVLIFNGQVSSAVAYRITSGGVAQLSGTGSGLYPAAIGTQAKQAMSWSAASGRGFLNGSTDITVGAITVPVSFTTISIGTNEAGTTNQPSGTTKSIYIWKFQPTDADMQRITV